MGAESIKKNPTSSINAHKPDKAIHPIAHRLLRGKTTLEVDDDGIIYSVAFLSDGEDIVSGGRGGNSQCWRRKDGRKVGTAMRGASSGGYIFDIGVSPDGRWLVSATDTDLVTVTVGP